MQKGKKWKYHNEVFGHEQANGGDGNPFCPHMTLFVGKFRWWKNAG